MSEKQLKAMAEAGFYVSAEFVPFSKSRNAKEKDLSLNWRVSVHKIASLEEYPDLGRLPKLMPPVLTTDYQAGIGHCPAYKNKDVYVRDELIKHECEKGFTARYMPSCGFISNGKRIECDPVSVAYCLLLDASAIDAGSFENWASEFGCDTDSRKAEKIYNSCVAQGLALRAAFGGATLSTLRKAFEEY